MLECITLHCLVLSDYSLINSHYIRLVIIR